MTEGIVPSRHHEKKRSPILLHFLHIPLGTAHKIFKTIDDYIFA